MSIELCTPSAADYICINELSGDENCPAELYNLVSKSKLSFKPLNFEVACYTAIANRVLMFI